MIKWIGKIKQKIWRQDLNQDFTISNYGQYVHKPVISRAISVVVGISQEELCSWIENPEIKVYLNGEQIQGATWALRRLEAGNYEIKIPSHNKIWTFFIL